MKYKYFLFDWDGTLADSLPIWVPAMKETFKEFGIEVTEQEIGEKVIANWNGPSELGVTDQEAFFMSAANKLKDELPWVSLVDGVKELLMEIKKRGGKIGVLTSSMRGWVLPAMERAGISDMVDVFLGKEDVTKNKPSPEIVEKALLRLEGDKEYAVMIGDHQKDVETAQNAGIDSILYYPRSYAQYYRKEFQESLGATYIVDDMWKLLEVLK